MQPPIETSWLLQRLATSGRSDLLAKVLDLRNRVGRYLHGVHSTFPHYTSHAVDHSDEIVWQLSALLKAGASGDAMTEAEIFLLALAAYVHDVGMVVSEEDKRKALVTPEWSEFVADTSGTRDVFDTHKLSSDEELYRAAYEQRLLLAEFFRRQHASRAAEQINGALAVGRDYLEDDPVAVRTLTAVCTGHGLHRRDLEDAREYPLLRTVFNQDVNVRFLAVLLRLGDLLDMRYQRACPMMRTLASPLPDDSSPHWDQYGRINDRATSSTEIRVGAICHTADEHRLLRDWCQWIVDEISEAPKLLHASTRSTVLPRATMGTVDSTIRIERAPGVSYRVVDWRFELEPDEVFARLVNDAETAPFDFLRELLQNALDATRVTTSSFARSGDANVEQASIDAHAVEVALSSDSDGRIASIAVVDRGVGMTQEIVQKYLLQVGRSWYRSPEFRQRYSFTPSSQFGVGFLTCFAVSNDVCVTTRHVESGGPRGLRLKLAGPRSYIVVEDAEKESAGTTVEVKLTRPAVVGDVETFLKNLCVANEYPVTLTLDGRELNRFPVIPSPPVERVPVDEETELRLVTARDSGAGRRAVAHFYVLGQGTREDWSLSVSRLNEQYFTRVDSGDSWVALNGLQSTATATLSPYDGDVSVHIDVRDSAPRLRLDRANIDAAAFTGFLAEAVQSHLATRPPQDYVYRSAVVRRFRFSCPRGWAENIPALFRLVGRDGELYRSANELADLHEIRLVWSDAYAFNPYPPTRAIANEDVLARSLEGANAVAIDIDRNSYDSASNTVLGGRELSYLMRVSTDGVQGWVATLARGSASSRYVSRYSSYWWLSFPDELLVGRITPIGIVLNEDSRIARALRVVPEGRSYLTGAIADRDVRSSSALPNKLRGMLTVVGRRLGDDALLRLAESDVEVRQDAGIWLLD